MMFFNLNKSVSFDDPTLAQRNNLDFIAQIPLTNESIQLNPDLVNALQGIVGVIPHRGLVDPEC